MSRLVKLMLCGAVLGAWALAYGADSLTEMKKAQNKLLAQRAARADAIRKLSERINGLKITAKTTVRDFVTESDTIKTAMIGFLSGMKEEDVKYADDGICTVTMSIQLTDLVVAMEQMYKAYYKGSKVTIEDIRKITVTNEVKTLTETGNGAPRPELAADAAVPIPVGKTAASVEGMNPSAKAFWTAHVTPQGRLMALRAAQVDGMRRLAERIKGVFITSKTTVQDFVTQSDDIKVDLRTFLRGARESGVRYHPDELIVEVTMEVTLQSILAELKTWGEIHYKGDKVIMQQLEELTISTKKEIVEETGTGVPPESMLKDVPAGEIAILAVAAKAPDWIGQTLRATGNGALDTANENKAQAKLMAFRAAELDARRKLAEQVDGLMITSNTSVKDFITQNDEIRTSMLTFQQGVSVVEGSQKLTDDGTASATVEINLKPLWDMIIYYQRKLSITVK